MKAGLVFVIILLSVQSCSSQRAPSKPELFMPGFVSTSLPERDMAISPNGDEMFFTIASPLSAFQTIAYSRKDQSGNWMEPQVAPFCGHYSDLEPAFTSDGNRLYFSSNRPINGDAKKDFDIWFVEKVNGVWGKPVNMGAPVNTLADEFYPSITKSGNLYFTAAYENGVGEEDIFVSELKSGAFQKPAPLDTSVNSSSYEFNAFVSQDEKYLIFTACGRRDGKGGCDLYLSRRENGKWTKAKNMELINSNRLDYCPFLSFDGNTLYFTSERHEIKVAYPERSATIKDLQDANQAILNSKGNIFWVDFSSLVK
jgi:WD40-like Beta Propeller Repeat